jgi:uncharacterized metal-binding protein YceD (DUF177 family)
MRIPISQISESGWTRTLDIPLGSLRRVVEEHGPQSGKLNAAVTLKNHRGCIDVRGRLTAELTVACRLCLEHGPVQVAAPLELMAVPMATWRAAQSDSVHKEVRLSVRDLDVSYYEGEELDLTQLLEDELLLAAPDSLGEEDEDGKCLHCGRDVAALLAPKEQGLEHHPFRELAQRIGKAAAEPDSKD